MRVTLKTTFVLLIIALIVTSSVTLFEYNEVASLQDRIKRQENEISQLQTKLNDAQSALAIKPVNPQYLPFGTLGSSESKIFLLSATPLYGQWQLNDTPIGYPQIPGLNYSLVMHNDDPIFTINITVRNDYTSEDAGNTTVNPNLHIGKVYGTDIYSSFVILSAQLFDQNGNQIGAYDVTQPITAGSGYEFTLKSGETKSYTMMFSTDRRDISYYKIYVIESSAYPQP